MKKHGKTDAVFSHRDNPAYVIDFVNAGEETTYVFGNHTGQDSDDFETQVSSLNEFALSEMREGVQSGTSLIIVYCYAMQIPVWVRDGYERAFIESVYPDPRQRREYASEKHPSYKYEYQMWAAKQHG